MDVLKQLQELSESDYKAFNKKIVPTEQQMLGVRLPALRKIAKQIVKDDPYAFITLDKQNIYEMVMLEGIVLSELNEPFVELKPLTEAFIDKVDNWAQIDSTVGKLKRIKRERAEVLSVVKEWLKSDKEFVVRAGLIILLSKFVEQEYLDEIFTLSQAVEHKAYYVMMANAWLISVCMAKFPTETMPFFESNLLDNITHNNAIQKSRDSYRVSKEDKVRLKELKR